MLIANNLHLSKERFFKCLKSCFQYNCLSANKAVPSSKKCDVAVSTIAQPIDQFDLPIYNFCVQVANLIMVKYIKYLRVVQTFSSNNNSGKMELRGKLLELFSRLVCEDVWTN